MAQYVTMADAVLATAIILTHIHLNNTEQNFRDKNNQPVATLSYWHRVARDWQRGLSSCT